MTLALRYALRSDVGLLREGNEDSAYAGPHLLAIADGMGGHAAGEVASAVAIAALAPLDQELPADMLAALAAAVSSASGTLHQMSVADPSVEGMGTTVTAMLWSGDQLALCHIGDSRAYLLRDGDFQQITRDHTLIQSLVDEGRLSPAAAANHPQRSLIMRALQGSADVQPDLTMREGVLGDRYLLCSDGLSDVVSDDTLHKTLMKYADLDTAVLQLIELAIRGGGPDNITCIVADVVDAETGPLAPSRGSVVAGAASNSDGRPMLRADTPAGRAHLLTQAPPAPTAQHARPQAQERSYQQDGWPEHHSEVPEDEDDDEESDDRAGHGTRRRLPVVKSILAVLVIVIIGGGYAAWRYTQSQYYVGADSGQVAIFRGVNQQVAGISLSRVYQRTGIPMSRVAVSDQPLVQATITATSLADAHKTVQTIRDDFTCQQVAVAVAKWQAGKPKPVTRKVKKHGKTVLQTTTPKYRPAPAVPSYCKTVAGAAG
jgi:serine/threonine protein phosphatase PrpC